MNKIWLIIKREYSTRVRKKTFILSTILTPLLFVGLITAVTIISVKNLDQEKIAVIDNAGLFKGNLENGKAVTFEFPAGVDSSNYLEKGYSAILYTPDKKSTRYRLISKKQLGMVAASNVEKSINQTIEDNLLKTRYNIDIKQLDSIRNKAEKAEIDHSIKGGKNAEVIKGNSALAYGIGYGSGFLIYITLFIYGTMVMRGVMEEKTNRIAEVMVSSVKPFQLMIGKIVGIGAVGLTQFVIWIILIVGLSAAAGAIFSPETLQQAAEANQQLQTGGAAQLGTNSASKFVEIKDTLGNANWPLIIGCFLFYFTFGYLFYAALFAAVGSAVNEDPQDAQSLLLPIMMPLIVALVIMINAITNPASNLAAWSSLIPFFSPIVMMARIPFGVPGTVPYWQLGFSMLFLVAGFLLITWLSAKIYRVGILMYGKKVSWKEMCRWAFRKY